MGIELPEDVATVLRSVAVLLDDDTASGVAAADPAAGAAENRAIIRARARQARRRSAELGERAAALGEQVEQLWRRHQELRVATARTQAPRSEAHHQATGILLLILGITPAQAGHLLAMLSWQHGCSPDAFAQRLVDACVGDGAPVAVVPGPAPVDRAGTPQTVRRAVAFIQQHLRDDITVDDISVASGVGQRALQHAFRRHFGTTPTGYLRRTRMECAHRQLLAADPSRGDTVAAIAETWRFAHHGRFALAYRATYGTSPAEALRH